MIGLAFKFFKLSVRCPLFSYSTKIFGVIFWAVVTNEEVNLAVTEGDVVTTPPGTNQMQLPTNGLSEAEAGNDPGNYNMEETKYVPDTQISL